LSGCASNGVFDRARKTLRTLPDPYILVAQIGGFRTQMSPRKVAQIVLRDGLHESDFNSVTLEDIIRTNDIKPFEGGLILKKKSNNILAVYGSKSISLYFCNGKVQSISENSWILKSDLTHFKNRDKRMFPKMKFDEKKENKKHIILGGRYQPGKYSLALVYYLDRGFTHKGKVIYERSIDVLDGLTCLKEDYRKILGY